MGDVIHLNRFKKKKARTEKERRADTNRRLHGRTKAEREVEAKAKERLDKQLRGARLDRRPALVAVPRPAADRPAPRRVLEFKAKAPPVLPTSSEDGEPEPPG